MCYSNKSFLFCFFSEFSFHNFLTVTQSAGEQISSSLLEIKRDTGAPALPQSRPAPYLHLQHRQSISRSVIHYSLMPLVGGL